MSDDRLFILGAGRAGSGLARAFRASGVCVVGVHGRRRPGGPDGVSVGPLPDSLGDATIVLVTVRDGQLDAALDELRAAGRLADGAVVLHASGSAEPASLGVLRRLGHPAGTFHPLVPMADPAHAAERLRGAWIGVDGDAAARAAASRLAAALGASVLPIPPGAKPRYHAAAVIASNFPVVLLAIAERLLAGIGVREDAADAAVRALFLAAAENLRVQPALAALTGPIARGDVETVARHLAALADDPDVAAIYRVLSGAAVDLARRQGAAPDRLRAIAERLADG